MGKDKLRRFTIVAQLDSVFQYDDYTSGTLINSKGDAIRMNGNWSAHFQNSNPIHLELACGKGHYTVGLARLLPDDNFIGMDIKGARFFVGATSAHQEGLNNVAFIRTHIEHIEHCFKQNEIQDIWITFADPQQEERRKKKRLTHQRYLEAYARLMQPNGKVHLKTDSDSLYYFTLETLQSLNITPLINEYNIDEWAGFSDVLAIHTDYEVKHRALGATIKYVVWEFPESFRLHAQNTKSAFVISK